MEPVALGSDKEGGIEFQTAVLGRIRLDKPGANAFGIKLFIPRRIK